MLWIGNFARVDESRIVKITFEWKPLQKIMKSRPRERCRHDVEEDMKQTREYESGEDWS